MPQTIYQSSGMDKFILNVISGGIRLAAIWVAAIVILLLLATLLNNVPTDLFVFLLIFLAPLSAVILINWAFKR